jgi:hypothetical protein
MYGSKQHSDRWTVYCIGIRQCDQIFHPCRIHEKYHRGVQDGIRGIKETIATTRRTARPNIPTTSHTYQTVCKWIYQTLCNIKLPKQPWIHAWLQGQGHHRPPKAARDNRIPTESNHARLKPRQRPAGPHRPRKCPGNQNGEINEGYGNQICKFFKKHQTTTTNNQSRWPNTRKCALNHGQRIRVKIRICFRIRH